MICCLRGPQSRGSVWFPVGFTPGLFDFNAHGRVWSLVCTEGKLPVRCWCGAFCKNIYTRVVIGFRGFGSFVLVLLVYFPAFWGLFSSGTGFVFGFRDFGCLVLGLRPVLRLSGDYLVLVTDFVFVSRLVFRVWFPGVQSVGAF